jgi:hypothetical protein
MKLLLCTSCEDVVKLGSDEWRECKCGASAGRYIDRINAEIKGDAIPIGFANGSLLAAIRKRPEDGMGSVFTAFVIPKKCDSIKER